MRKQRTKRSNDGEGALGLARRLALAPIVASRASSAPAAPCLVEPAWDGHRVLATRVGDEVRLASPDFRDWTATFPALVRALADVPAQSFALDGVVCLMDERGVPSFDHLRAAVATGKVVTRAALLAWDLLWVDGDDLRAQPVTARRAKLAPLLARAAPALLASEELPGDLSTVLAAVASLGIRGVVARRRDAPYDGAWHALSPTDEPVVFDRSLSPPPPLSNADKVLYPRDGITKRDIAAYYRDVAPLLVPHLVDRPVVVQRWVDGIDAFDWYQHRMPPRAPDYLRAAWVEDIRRIVLENTDALLWMANQAGLTYHGFASRLRSLEAPDYAIIDLDPGESTTPRNLVDVALAVRKVLDLLELPSVLKTSGQRGLHVLVPLAPGHTFEQADALSLGVGELVLRLLPSLVTLEVAKEKRGGRLLVDYRQFKAKTLVLPYSLRGVDGAPVSTPLAWDELTPAYDPRAFTMRTVRARFDARGDLAAPLLAGTTRLEPALARLRSAVPKFAPG